MKEQASVQSFDALCEVQSDKASVEITSPYDGVVKRLLVAEGEVAKVGQGLCLIEVEDDGSAPPTDTESDSTPVPDVTASAASEPPLQSAPPQRKHPLDPTNVSPTPTDILATPSVRHFARQHGVDLAAIAPGSGRDGRVDKKDIEAFMSGGSKAPLLPMQEDVVVDLGRTRYGMWKAMVQVRSRNVTIFLRVQSFRL